MPCLGQCDKYKANGIPRAPRYANGQKRCQNCDIYLKWDGKHCPCCNQKLRTKPRGLAKKAYNIKVNISKNEYTAIGDNEK